MFNETSNMNSVSIDWVLYIRRSKRRRSSLIKMIREQKHGRCPINVLWSQYVFLIKTYSGESSDKSDIELSFR